MIPLRTSLMVNLKSEKVFFADNHFLSELVRRQTPVSTFVFSLYLVLLIYVLSSLFAYKTPILSSFYLRQILGYQFDDTKLESYIRILIAHCGLTKKKCSVHTTKVAVYAECVHVDLLFSVTAFRLCFEIHFVNYSLSIIRFKTRTWKHTKMRFRHI